MKWRSHHRGEKTEGSRIKVINSVKCDREIKRNACRERPLSLVIKENSTISPLDKTTSLEGWERQFNEWSYKCVKKLKV